MDLDYLVDDVMAGVKRLHVEVLKKLDMPVYAVASRRDGKRRLLPMHGQPEEVVWRNLKVTARVPVWGSLNVRGHHLWDGVLVEPVPIQAAMDLGATHVLHLSRECLEKTYDGWDISHVLQTAILRVRAPDLHKVVKRQNGEMAAIYPSCEMFTMGLVRPNIHVATRDARKVWTAVLRAYRYAGDVLTGHHNMPLPYEWNVPT